MNTSFQITPTIKADVDVAHGSKSGLPNRSFLVPPLPWLQEDKDNEAVQSAKTQINEVSDGD